MVKQMSKSILSNNFLKATIILIVLTAGTFVAYDLATKPKTREFDITAQHFKFTPGVLSVNKGDTVILKIHSIDGFHGFFLDGYNIERDLPVDTVIVVTFVANMAGKFTFRCSVTCGNFHPYMIGELNVQPNVLFYSVIAIAGLMALAMIWQGFNYAKKLEQMQFLPMAEAAN